MISAFFVFKSEKKLDFETFCCTVRRASTLQGSLEVNIIRWNED